MLTLSLMLTLALQTTTPEFTPDQLWQNWPDDRFVQTPAPCIRPADLTAELQRLARQYPDDMQFEEIGRSWGGRPIHMITLGRGARTILLWSQMHGDEPSATPALLDMASFLLSRIDRGEASAILDEFTLLMIPMLNPDGSEVYQRRNLQEIDINRDALHLATPEGRILKKIRDEHEPMLGFNLHDQGRRIAVGATGVLATMSVLAVAGDEEGTVTPGRLRAKRACTAIVKTLDPFIPGGVARYNEDWNVRAFGDNVTAWGTPVVLIESGGLPPGLGPEDLTRLNYVALLTVLGDLARDDLESFDPQVYEDLHRNKRNAWADVVVQGGFVRQPSEAPPFRADLAFNLEVDDRDAAGCATGDPSRSYIAEIGDAGFLGAGRIVDAGGSLLISPLVAGVEGFGARRWLNAEVLSNLAHLGVGTVVWEVPGRKVGVAESLARELAGRGRARLEVVPRPAEMPWLELNGPPLEPRSDALFDAVSAVSRGQQQINPVDPDSLGMLSRTPHSETRQPTLRQGSPASFLLLTPASDGEIELESANLSSIFIDGLDLKRTSR